jgi:hypothetical protein
VNLAEALRKIRLLRRITRNGASAAEAKTAANLARALMERFAILAEDARPARVAPARLSWIYWESLLEKFDIKLKRFGRRRTARLDSGLLVFIRLDTGHWSVKKQGSNDLALVASDFGVESFRALLRETGSRSYSLVAA